MFLHFTYVFFLLLPNKQATEQTTKERKQVIDGKAEKSKYMGTAIFAGTHTYTITARLEDFL